MNLRTVITLADIEDHLDARMAALADRPGSRIKSPERQRRIETLGRRMDTFSRWTERATERASSAPLPPKRKRA